MKVVVPDSLLLITWNKLPEHALTELKESIHLVLIVYSLHENDFFLHMKLYRGYQTTRILSIISTFVTDTVTIRFPPLGRPPISGIICFICLFSNSEN